MVFLAILVAVVAASRLPPGLLVACWGLALATLLFRIGFRGRQAAVAGTPEPTASDLLPARQRLAFLLTALSLLAVLTVAAVRGWFALLTVGVLLRYLAGMSAVAAGVLAAHLRPRGRWLARRDEPAADAASIDHDGAAVSPGKGAPGHLRRWRPVVLTWVLLSLLSNAPYLVAALDPPPGRTFVGFFFYAEDMLNYASYIQQAEDGAFVFKNKLFWRDGPATYVNVEWWMVGVLSRLLGRHPALAYRLFGLVVSLFFIATVDRWLRRAGLPDSHRTPALVLIGTAAGLGGIRFLILHAPLLSCLDFMAGVFPVWQLLYNPHSVAGTTLALWTLDLYTDAHDGKGALRAGLVGTLLGLVRPYELAVAAGVRVLAVVATQPPQTWLYRLAPLLGLAPVFLYNTAIFMLDPGFAWASSSVFSPPLLWPLPWAFAPALLLAALALWRKPGSRPAAELRANLVAWIVLGALLLVAPPINYPLQFLGGTGLACLMLGALGLRRWRPALTLAVAVVMSSTAVASVHFMLDRPAPWFVRQERWDAALALRESCRKGGRLFAPSDIGQYVGALTACSPIVSYYAMPDHDAKRALVTSFYLNPDPGQRAALLTRLGITHLALPGDAGARPSNSLGPDTPFRRVGLVGRGPTTVSLYARAAN